MLLYYSISTLSLLFGIYLSLRPMIKERQNIKINDFKTFIFQRGFNLIITMTNKSDAPISITNAYVKQDNKIINATKSPSVLYEVSEHNAQGQASYVDTHTTRLPVNFERGIAKNISFEFSVPHNEDYKINNSEPCTIVFETSRSNIYLDLNIKENSVTEEQLKKLM